MSNNCDHILTKGPRSGANCGRRCGSHSKCSLHREKNNDNIKPIQQVTQPQPQIQSQIQQPTQSNKLCEENNENIKKIITCLNEMDRYIKILSKRVNKLMVKELEPEELPLMVLEDYDALDNNDISEIEEFKSDTNI